MYYLYKVLWFPFPFTLFYSKHHKFALNARGHTVHCLFAATYGCMKIYMKKKIDE